MAKPTARFVIVGDDKQAIFGFRGADTTALDRLKSKLNATEMGLTITRRCPKSHVALAMQVCPDFQAAPEAPEGTVTDNLYVDRLVQDIQPGHMVISRTNAPLVPTCLKLLRAGKRAYVAGRDFGSALSGIIRKLKLNTLTALSEKLSGWLDTEIKRISGKKQAKDDKWLADQIEQANDKVDTILAMSEGLTTSDESIARINTLCIEPDDAAQNAIMLGTTHKVKGLEAHTTWVLEGTFNSAFRGKRGNVADDSDLVWYVAITRSYDTMHLVQGFDKSVKDE
jgi:DNA helicase-2/ATP-dependent DNA helicase PcrA